MLGRAGERLATIGHLDAQARFDVAESSPGSAPELRGIELGDAPWARALPGAWLAVRAGDLASCQQP